MRLSKLFLATAAATVVFGVLASTASARSFQSSATTLRTQFRELSFAGIFGTTVCQLTLEGSLHSRTIAKLLNSLIGYITAARLGPCPVGTATILGETLPWHIRYDSFAGTLPNISRITTNVVNLAIIVRTNVGERCLTRSTATQPVLGLFELAAGVISSASIAGTTGTGAECFGALGAFTSDRGPVTVLNSTTRVTLRLI